MGVVLKVTQRGNFQKTDRFLHRLVEFKYAHRLRYYGEKGVQALKAATPVDTGKTAESWSYEIVEEKGRTALYWKNDNKVDGVSIALILQYGHGTRNGGFVEGINYIPPAIRPIFDQMAKEVWKEVVS